MSSTTLSLLDLPLEIHSHICSYLLPNNYAFNFGSQRPVPPAKSLTWRNGTKVRWTPDNQHNESPNLRKDVLSVLLIHPKLHHTALRELYLSNIFCFPDIFTVSAFATQISAYALASTRSVAIDGVGSEMSPRTRAFYNQNCIVEPDVQETVRCFPGLRELTLGNIGPGVVRDMPYVLNGREYTRRAEDLENWRRMGIELVAKLIDSETSSPYEPELVPVNPLSNAHVICAKPLESDVNKSWGYLRLLGTRLVRRGVEVNLTQREQEILDVDAVLQRAREFDAGEWMSALQRDMRMLGSEIVRGGTPVAVAVAG